MVPVNIKSSESLDYFCKSKIKCCTQNHCPCRICKTYIGQVGFVNQILFLCGYTICLTLFFKDRICKTFKINVKIFNLFAFIVPDNVLLYLPDNVLLYLALIRPVFFCIRVIVKPNCIKTTTKRIKREVQLE